MTEIPPLKAHGVEIPDLEARRSAIRENRRELRLAQSQLPRLEQDVERARVEDTRAAVKAKREGKQDPGRKREDKAQAELAALHREIAVLEGLDIDLANEAREILRQHAEEISEGLQATLREANNTQLAAIAQFEAARAQRLLLQTVLAQVAAALPQEAEAQGGAGDYVEVIHHYDPASVHRVDERQIQKVFAYLRAEAGDTAQRDELVAMENPPADVFHLGAGALPVPEGKIFYEQRKAERTASAADTTGG